MKNAQYNREIFEKIRGIEQGSDIMPFTFRSELKLDNNTQNYDFPVLVEDSVARSKTENRINKNDRFYITSLGLFLLKRTTGKEGLDVLQTYPNAVVFPDVASQFNNEHLEVVYNGKFRVEIDQKAVIEELPAQEFRVVPQTLQLAADTYSQRDNSMGMVDLPAYVVLNGNATNLLRLTIPSFSGMLINDSTSTTTENRVVLVAKGFLVKNAAKK